MIVAQNMEWDDMKDAGGKFCMSLEGDALEALAQLEHEQWMHWSKAVAHEVSASTREQWQRFWVPYAALSEDVKEADRIWARKVVELLRRRG